MYYIVCVLYFILYMGWVETMLVGLEIYKFQNHHKRRKPNIFLG